MVRGSAHRVQQMSTLRLWIVLVAIGGTELRVWRNNVVARLNKKKTADQFVEIVRILLETHGDHTNRRCLRLKRPAKRLLKKLVSLFKRRTVNSKLFSFENLI